MIALSIALYVAFAAVFGVMGIKESAEGSADLSSAILTALLWPLALAAVFISVWLNGHTRRAK